MKIVTLGEIMLRLSTPGNTRFVQSDSFDVVYGGGEANVAVSCANYGHEAYFVSKLPKHEIGQSAVNALRKYGVRTDFIARGGDRVGIYYLETGASMRPSKVIYDRAHSSIAEADPQDFDFDAIMEGADWFHWSGITPAISDKAAELTRLACEAARRHGVTVSVDLNFRKKLWTKEKAQSIMKPLMQYVDVCIGNEEDAELCLGFKPDADVEGGETNAEGYKGIFRQMAATFGFKYVISTLRESFSATHNGWKAMIYNGEEFYESKRYDIDPIIDGVGGVMSFVPLIMLIFLQIAFLEDTGYMARMAYMLDRIFRIFGLHGCSVMPFIVGGGIAGGCAVPGVLAARTLRSPREKIATLLTVPFMACGAKLPVFILFSGVFFPGHEAAVMFGLTLTGWVVALLTARLLRSTIIRGPSTPFVMELPPYRLPTMLGLAIHTGERTFEYLKKAGTVILAISIILWAAMAYPQLPLDTRAHFAGEQQTIEANLEAAKASGGDVAALEEQLTALHGERAERALQHSFAGRLGMALEPLTRPAGFDWRTDIALVGGFAAKEVIVATLGTAYSLGDIDPEDPTPLAQQIRNDGRWTPATALALLVFVLLYAPCLVTVAAIRQETGSWGWPVFSMVFNTLIAFGAAVAVRHVTMLFL